MGEKKVKYMKKWIKSNGDNLNLFEYKSLFNYAKRYKIDFETHLRNIGITEDKSNSIHQDPKSNSAKLVGWTIEEENEEGAEVKFLTKWGYKRLSEEAKEHGISIDDLLIERGYHKYYVDKKYTSYINIEDGEILSRSMYQKYYRETKDKGINIAEYLKEKGYRKILDAKK